ncbi:hypothetical protein [Mesobacillus jeotgali]|uniref:hypothetical protein n=1 Tax=Mesobacillus jeotgali TaxID=129985 RepID=UPI0009A63A04|nr:hypothetical protein [Mesobacillus jeotgali]
MKNEVRAFAENVLQHLFIEARVKSFMPGTKKLYFHNNAFSDGQLYLNIESRWCLYRSSSEQFPASEYDMDEYSEAEASKIISEIQRQEVAGVELGKHSPHLIFTFKNGYILFVNGSHNDYECWQAGVLPEEDWMVVAAPGNEMAVWVPDGYDPT